MKLRQSPQGPAHWPLCTARAKFRKCAGLGGGGRSLTRTRLCSRNRWNREFFVFLPVILGVVSFRLSEVQIYAEIAAACSLCGQFPVLARNREFIRTEQGAQVSYQGV